MKANGRQDMTAKEEERLLMTRRQALQRVSALLGGVTLISSHAFLNLALAGDHSGSAEVEGLFSPQEIAFLDEVAETILPETGTPGARAAGVGPFMALMVTDGLSPDDQARFKEGMITLDAGCIQMFGAGFLAVTAEQKLEYLQVLDQEQVEMMKGHEEGMPAHYFRTMKELVLLGYFTSEIGCTQAMRYVESPGQYKPCLPYAPGDRAWARHA